MNIFFWISAELVLGIEDCVLDYKIMKLYNKRFIDHMKTMPLSQWQPCSGLSVELKKSSPISIKHCLSYRKGFHKPIWALHTDERKLLQSCIWFSLSRQDNVLEMTPVETSRGLLSFFPFTTLAWGQEYLSRSIFLLH